MHAYATPEDSFSRRMEALWEHVETEFHYAVGYVDRVVVPEVRREAGSAARVVAQHLERLADKLHPLSATGPADANGRQGGNRGL